MIDMPQARALMVEQQLVRRGVNDPAVLKAMADIPRELFVPESLRDFAYDDMPLAIEAGQTISQPFIVAAMIQAARLQPADTVLEVGAGSGYAAAVMAAIARQVEAIERHRVLADSAAQRLKTLCIRNVAIHCGDGTLGWPAAAPYDVIIVSAAGPRPPDSLKAQLKSGGRLLIPIGEPGRAQRLIKVTRSTDADFNEDDLGPVGFVPLIGNEGWPESASARTPSPPDPSKARFGSKPGS